MSDSVWKFYCKAVWNGDEGQICKALMCAARSRISNWQYQVLLDIAAMRFGGRLA